MARGPRVKYEHPELPNALNWLRSRLRLSQEEVATAAGISKVYYSQLERGTVSDGAPKYPSVPTLESVLGALHSDWDELDGLLVGQPWADNPELKARSFRMRTATPKPALYDELKKGPGSTPLLAASSAHSQVSPQTLYRTPPPDLGASDDSASKGLSQASKLNDIFLNGLSDLEQLNLLSLAEKWDRRRKPRS